MNPDRLRSRLRHVYWLGGSPCSGKSTVAEHIAQRCEIDVYHVDEAVLSRFGPYSLEMQPCMHRWTVGLSSGDVTWDDLWMKPPNALLREVCQCYREQFELVLADLLRNQTAAPVLVEGNPLLPRWVMPLASCPAQALWLVASEKFQRQMYPRRGAWVQEILGRCSAPDVALRNWMDRDVAFGVRVMAEAEQVGGALIRVDGDRSIGATVGLVAKMLGLGPEDGMEDGCSGWR